MRAARAVALMVAAFVAAACEPPGPITPVGAPPFSLPDLGGRTVSLADFAGRTVVIDFWATWCAPCKEQIPVLNELHRTSRPEELVVLGVSVDVVGRDEVAAFAAEQGIEYPVLLGSEALARDYGVPGFPALVVVDGEGRVVDFHLGVVTPAELAEAVATARR